MGNYQSSEQPRFPLKIRKIKRYGALPDIPDQRDIYTTFPKTIEYYQTEDLRKYNFFPEVFTQGELGSSVAHALLAAYIFSLKKDGISTEINFSPQFIYYNQRLIAGTVECDSGASIRDGIKILERLGVCTEEMYPYDLNFFKERPTDESYEFAYKNKHPIQYRRVRPLLEDIMKSISIKLPVLMGFTVYDSFQHPDVARTGIMPVPKPGEKIIGHHCVLIIGYDIPKKYLLCRNSWGSTWGQGGHIWIPFSFINSRNCSDFWIISTSSGSKPVAKLSSTNPSKSATNQANQATNQANQANQATNKLNSENQKKIEKIIEKVPDFKDDDASEDEKLEEDDTIV